MSNFLYGANIHANGIRQHYLRYGGKGQPLLIVPGITSPAITWGFIAERFSKHFDTYVLDVRGRGLSSTGPDLAYDIDSCADDIIEFTKELGLKDYILVGHSMGARFGIKALARGDKNMGKLVLVDPPVSGPNRREYPSKLPWYVDSIRAATKGCDLNVMREYCATWSDEQLSLRAEWLHTCYEPAIVDAFNGFHEDDIHQDISSISIPTLLMVAENGGVILPEDEDEIQGLLPSIKINAIKDAGHMIPWDNFDGFFEGFKDFLGTKL
jgi:N-formylmaleamate deformylase